MKANPTQTASSPLSELLSQMTPTAALSLVVLACVFVIALLAPFIAPYDEGKILTNVSFEVANEELLLGGDYLGRDIASRLIYGARVTLSLAIAISTLAFFVGASLGFMAAVRGGWVDTILSRVVDALISFPSIMVALIVIASLGPSYLVLVFTVAAIDATRVFRVSRALAMDAVVQDYVEAARVRGEGLRWIMAHEILPNTLGPMAAEYGVRFTYAILFISALSFLGLGVQPPHADLGVMVKENMQGLLYQSYAPIYPALGIAAITLSVNMLVDWYLKSTDAVLPDEL